MSEIDDLLAAARTDPPPSEGRPARHLAIVTCMDARIDPATLFGLRPGDAHVIRNAGGLITDDVLRSLALSQRALGTTAVLVMHHTKCGVQNLDDAGFRSQLADETGVTPGWDVPGFTDVEQQARDSARRVRECPWLPHTDQVRGAVFDVTTGRVEPVS